MDIGIRKGTLTSKERVLMAIHHAEPDRVPIDYSANPGIHSRLAQALGIPAQDYDAVIDALGVDFRGLYLPYTGPRLHPEIPNRKVDPLFGIHTRWVENESGGYDDFCDFPLASADEETVASWPMPNPDDFDYEVALEQCRRFKDKALYFGDPGFGDLINSTGMIRGMEQTLVDLATDDPAGLLYMDRKTGTQIAIAERLLERCKGYLSFFWMGEDLGTQHAPMLSLELYRRHLKPRHRRVVEMAESFGLPVMIHSCGSSSWAFDEFIDIGIQAVDTIQPEAKDMSPAYLKSRYGRELCFHGAISTTGALSFGTPEDVTREAESVLETMKPGGGYCLAPSHMIQDNSPVENVLALYETVHRAGWYR